MGCHSVTDQEAKAMTQKRLEVLNRKAALRAIEERETFEALRHLAHLEVVSQFSKKAA
jgi:hypothetical protein